MYLISHKTKHYILPSSTVEKIFKNCDPGVFKKVRIKLNFYTYLVYLFLEFSDFKI